MPSFKNGQQLGDKLGPKLARLVADTMTTTKRQFMPEEHRLFMHNQRKLAGWIGEEVAELHAPFFEQALRDGTLHPLVHEYMAKASSGKKQWQAVAAFAFGSSGVPNVLSNIMSNELATVGYDIVAQNPHLIPGVGDLVGMATKGIAPISELYHSAAGQGIGHGWFDRLIQATYEYPDVGTVLMLIRRGIVNEDTARVYLERSGVPSGVIHAILQTVEVLLSPADLADMVVRGIVDQGFGQREARKSGVPSEDFDKLVLDTGEPPSLTDLLEAHRRGFIDTTRLEHGIRQSRVRNEWIDVIRDLSQSPMSTADAITALVQHHISDGEARTVASQNGLMPQYFDILYQTSGEPISKTEVIQLLRRRVITLDTARQALSESRLKNKYIDSVLAETRALPPARTITTMLTHGGLTDAQAHQLLGELGYDAEVIAAYLKTARSEKTVSVKHLTQGLLGELYESKIITHAEFRDGLHALGFTDHDIAWITKYHDLRIFHVQQTSAITHVRTLYIERKLSHEQASARLDALGVNIGQRDQILADWDLERSTNVRSLTAAQILDAWHLQLLTNENCLTRLQTMGYSKGDAVLLMEIKAKGRIEGL